MKKERESPPTPRTTSPIWNGIVFIGSRLFFGLRLGKTCHYDFNQRRKICGSGIGSGEKVKKESKGLVINYGEGGGYKMGKSRV